MRRLFFPPIASLFIVLGLCWLTPPASLQQRDAASSYAKGGVGDVTGEYEIPDPKWPL
jgi:hypothetical protein